MKETLENKFNCIYNETYNSTLKYVISKCDNLSNVEDIMQNTYLKLYKIMHKKDYESYQIGLLIKLAKHELFKYYSLKNKIKALLNIENDYILIENIKDEKVNIDNKTLEKLSLESIWEIIKSEDLLTQKIITLYYMEDLKIKEIASTLKLSENTIKTRIYRTIKKIKAKLERGDGCE